MIEGCSIRATVRLTGVAKNTVVKLLADAGRVCAAYHDRTVRDLKVRRLQCDEIWCFIGAKAKNVSVEKKQEGWGDIWTWVGIDADTKLVVSYLVGGRDGGWAQEFMNGCARRIRNRVQITTSITTAASIKRFAALRQWKLDSQTILWTIEELCSLIPKPSVSESKIEQELLQKALANLSSGRMSESGAPARWV